MKPHVIAALIAALLLSSCASYEPSPRLVPRPLPSDLVVSGGLAATAEAVSNQPHQKAVFDADLTEAGVVALQVVVENRGAGRIEVRPFDMVLQLPGGQKISPSGIATVVNKVGEEGSIVGAAIAFGLIGVIAAASAQDQSRTARTADYQDKAFKDVVLSPADSAHGFVFFTPPRGVGLLDSATLRIRALDSETAASSYIEVPVDAFNFRGGGETAAAALNAQRVEEDAGGDSIESATAVETAEIRRQKDEAAIYLSLHGDEVKRDLYEYNKRYRLTRRTGQYRNFKLHDTDVLNAANGEVMVKVRFAYGMQRSRGSAIRVVRMQWIGGALKIVGHV